MTRVHDMGGRFGDGPVNPEPEDAPVFAEDWHASRRWRSRLPQDFWGNGTLMSRAMHGKDSPPRITRGFPTMRNGCPVLADLLVEKGVLTLDDLRGVDGDGVHPLTERTLKADAVAGALAKGGPADRPSNVEVRFQAGQAVRTLGQSANRLVDGGHTRLPIYAAGATGRILRLHGTHVLPDSNAHGLGEAPEPLYAVVFPASELWANPEHPADEVVLDLWQSYLEPA